MNMPRRARNPRNWLLVLVPPLVVLAGVAAVALFDLDAFLVFALFGLLNTGVTYVLGERQAGEAPARAGWEFHPPFRTLCARAGRAFAAGPLFLLAAFFLADNALTEVAGVLVAVSAFVVGGRILVRLLRDTPAVRLTVEGVEARNRRYQWEKIRGVELNGDRWHPRLDLLIDGRRHPLAIRPANVDASLLFLMDLIGYCWQHPEERHAIGRPEEAQRVHALLLHARLAAGLSGGPTPIAVGAR